MCPESGQTQSHQHSQPINRCLEREPSEIYRPCLLFQEQSRKHFLGLPVTSRRKQRGKRSRFCLSVSKCRSAFPVFPSASMGPVFPGQLWRCRGHSGEQSQTPGGPEPGGAQDKGGREQGREEGKQFPGDSPGRSPEGGTVEKGEVGEEKRSGWFRKSQEVCEAEAGRERRRCRDRADQAGAFGSLLSLARSPTCRVYLWAAGGGVNVGVSGQGRTGNTDHPSQGVIEALGL